MKSLHLKQDLMAYILLSIPYHSTHVNEIIDIIWAL